MNGVCRHSHVGGYIHIVHSVTLWAGTFASHRTFRDVVGGYIRIVHSVTHVEGGCGCRNIRKQDAPQASQEELDQKQFVSK